MQPSAPPQGNIPGCRRLPCLGRCRHSQAPQHGTMTHFESQSKFGARVMVLQARCHAIRNDDDMTTRCGHGNDDCMHGTVANLLRERPPVRVQANDLPIKDIMLCGSCGHAETPTACSSACPIYRRPIHIPPPNLSLNRNVFWLHIHALDGN